MCPTAYIRKKHGKLKFFFIIALIAVALTIVVTAHFALNVNPVIETLMAEEARHKITVITSESLKDVTGDNIRYDDIVNILRDSENNIQALSVNTKLLSDIALNTMLVTQMRLKSIEELQINVPIGTLSGVAFLSGAGGNVSFYGKPVGSVSISYKSEFHNAGINNTLHTITMLVDTSLNVIVPGLSRSVTVRTEVPLVDTVIVGKVPDTYLKSDSLDEMLNLTP